MPRKRSRSTKETEVKGRTVKKVKYTSKGYIEALVTALSKNYNNNGKK